jgi:hypothetical protein
MKIRSVGAQLYHADGRTDMTKLTAAFRNFANAPKNGSNKISRTYNTLHTKDNTINDTGTINPEFLQTSTS